VSDRESQKYKIQGVRLTAFQTEKGCLVVTRD
jgi:hypothetical protein